MISFLNNILKTIKAKLLFFIAADALLITTSVFLAFLLRFDGKIPVKYFEGILPGTIILVLLFCLPIFYFFRLYSLSWSYISINELISLVKALTIGYAFLATSLFILRDHPKFSGFPRSTFFISYFLIFLSCGGVRFGKRIYLQILKKGLNGKNKSRVLIVGAGDAGEQILRNILISKTSSYLPIGFVDDNLTKQGEIIHGLRVLGGISDIPKISEKYQIEEIIIALPSAGSTAIKKAVEKGRKAGLKKIKIVPSMSEIINGEISLANIREVELEDLLGREPVSLDMKSIEKFIYDKVVLITGAAGSIGSELSRQVAKFQPSLLLILDQDETGIFNIETELDRRFPRLEILPIIASIGDEIKIRKIFEEFCPQIVFHAAAYKHVPLMERHPDEAVKNNILGTRIVTEASLKFGAEKFIFISTDKAVNPTSIMGATKRTGEMICQVLNRKNRTKFVSVRFGNVLDSRGSVVPAFREQIKRGGPVEVTHPQMKRYFMTTPEACLLVMQAGVLGQGGEVFVLDMGEPVKILDLAKEMIRLSGFEPDKDIPIVFTEPRPGEKLFEEILTAEEGTVATQNQKIFRAKLSEINEEKLNCCLKKLEKITRETSKKEEIKSVLREIIPSYKNGVSNK